MAPRVRPRLGWVLPALSAGAVAVLLPLSIFLVTVWLLGGQLQAVLSGSMSPTYPVGSLLVVAPIDAGDVEPGMALVFEDPVQPGRVVTHRVASVIETPSLQFVTQGDANTRADAAPVPARMVRGRVLWHLRGLGVLLTWLAWPRGFIALVVLPAVLLLALEARKRVDRPAFRAAGREEPDPAGDGAAA